MTDCLRPRGFVDLLLTDYSAGAQGLQRPYSKKIVINPLDIDSVQPARQWNVVRGEYDQVCIVKLRASDVALECIDQYETLLGLIDTAMHERAESSR